MENTIATMAYTATTPVLQMFNSTNSTDLTGSKLYQNRRRLIGGLIVMGLGVLGNFLALIILARKKHNKNSKYTFMLR